MFTIDEHKGTTLVEGPTLFVFPFPYILSEEGDTLVKRLRVRELTESDMEREEDIFSKIENDGNTAIITYILDLFVCKR